ncbi:MAG: HAD-IIA family hydrolase [Chloroflexi bacterium]|nr:HAD-IIA family hydrolase [Chloroflexota bacterium]
MIETLQPPIRGMILDMDGVLWRGNEAIGDLPAFFEHLAQAGIKVVLATNNATRDAEQYLERLAGFGLHLAPWQIVNSAEAAAFYLLQKFPKGSPVYIVGEDGLVNTLNAHGFSQAADGALAVVAGMDRGINYEKLRQASGLIRGGALFLGTNPDTTFPTPNGLIPGAGAILAAIQAASGIEPVIAGKPERAMFDLALKRLGTSPQETLVVGDRLETDIAGGQKVGCRTALVLSGVTSLEEAEKWQPAPDVIARDIMALLE